MICEIMTQNMEQKYGKSAHTAIYYTTVFLQMFGCLNS